VYKDARSKVCRQCYNWVDKKCKIYKYAPELMKFPIYPLRANNEFYLNQMIEELASDNHTTDVVRMGREISTDDLIIIKLSLSDRFVLEVSQEPIDGNGHLFSVSQSGISLNDFKRYCLHDLQEREIRIEVQEALDNKGRRLKT
jgi:hypothetical protein